MSLTLLCCPMMFQGFSVRATVGLQHSKDFLQKLYTFYSYRKQCMPGRLICQHIIGHIAGVRNGNKVTVNVHMPSSFRADTSARKHSCRTRVLYFAGPYEENENCPSQNFKRAAVYLRGDILTGFCFLYVGKLKCFI